MAQESLRQLAIFVPIGFICSAIESSFSTSLLRQFFLPITRSDWKNLSIFKNCAFPILFLSGSTSSVQFSITFEFTKTFGLKGSGIANTKVLRMHSIVPIHSWWFLSIFLILFILFIENIVRLFIIIIKSDLAIDFSIDHIVLYSGSYNLLLDLALKGVSLSHIFLFSIATSMIVLDLDGAHEWRRFSQFGSLKLLSIFFNSLKLKSTSKIVARSFSNFIVYEISWIIII